MLYTRRKIILAILEVFGGELQAIRMQKLLFLFTRLQSDKSFDFVPYKYGCFSFQANQDIHTLKTYGYVNIDEDTENIQLVEQGDYLQMLDMFNQQAVRQIKTQFGDCSQDDLIEFTYKNYPYYSINSIIAKNVLNSEELAKVEQQKRHYKESQLFTIGYEGISLESYINRLILKDVRVLCDVRKNAYSQKYGFSKNQLQKACEGVGIKYIHVPQLGIESDKRQNLKTQTDYDVLFDKYEQTTLAENREALFYVRSIIDADKRVALTCFEKDPKQCHRSRVAKALMALPDRDYSFDLL